MKSVSDEMRQEYRSMLQSFRNDDSTDPIPNRYPWHGQTAILELLAAARTMQRTRGEGGPPVQIRVLTGSAPDHVYYAEESRLLWEDFLTAGGFLKVLIWGDAPLTCGGAIQTLCRKYRSVELRSTATHELVNAVHHFFLVDETAYRLEAPHATFDNVIFSDYHPEIPARICFNDKTFGTQLAKFFDELWDLCRPVPLERMVSAPHQQARHQPIR